VVLYRHRETLWNRELSALSPIPAAALLYDAKLRSDVGAANVTDLVVVSGESVEAALEGAERTGRLLEPLIAAGVIGGFDSPANFLPSLALQGARRSSLPDEATLRANLRASSAGLALDPEQLGPFIEDVEAARSGALIEPGELAGTSLAAGFDALMVHRSKRWDALLPLHAADPSRPTVDLARLRRVLADSPASTAQLLDFKQESDALYAGYLREAMRLCAIGFVAIIALLGWTLRSAARVLRVMAPLVLAVLAVAAGLAFLGRQLTLMHLVGMLLIVAVGSNYALFFDAHGRAHARADDPLTLASLSVANLCTVVGFGLLSFSGVPVLDALGVTVAPGALLALLFAAVLTPRSSYA
jgi:predicted exporter